MILIISDVHFGKSDRRSERHKERDLVSLIRTFDDSLTHLFLLGDVFDHFIEYRYTVPKGYARFMGLLADLADRGVRITYFLGNHDPWHRDLFASEFNAVIVPDHLKMQHGEHSIYFSHGDGKAERGWYKSIRPILRHKIPTTLYRYLLPGDTGVALARWSSHKFSAKEPKMATVALLRAYAEQVLQNGADVVVMGHCHKSELTETPDGIYLNSGSWHDDRTFGILTDTEIKLMAFKDAICEQLGAIPLAQER